MSRRPTVSDVAVRAQVHRSTAARALNPASSGMLSPETVSKVQRAARELGYTTNSFARGLRTSRSLTVGVLIPDLTNPLFPPIVRGIQEALLPHGYTALIANTDNDPEREAAHFDALASRQVDGFIVASAREEDPVLDSARRLGTPIVLVNRSTGQGRFPMVGGDDRDGVRRALEYLVKLGHTRVAHLAGPQGVSTAEIRAAAFRDAAASLGLRRELTPVVDCDAFTEDSGSRAAGQLFAAEPETTAVAAGNDLIALGCLRQLTALGRRCPADVSVVGYNDMRFADAFSPALTTVRVPHAAMGAEAARLLLEQITDPDAVVKTLLLPVELVVRDSTAAPPAAHEPGAPGLRRPRTP
jgi:LacI family transcriptional regulator